MRREERCELTGMGRGYRGVCAGSFLLVVTLGLLLSGCPDTDIGTTPPFDTTGNYSGTYNTDNGKQFSGASDCNIELELVQFVDQPVVAYTFAGIARLAWDCILPSTVRDALGITSDVLVSPVYATLDNDGGYSLEIDLDGSNIPQVLLDALDSSEVDTDIPLQSFSVVFTGSGEDSDSDGFMDSTTGTLRVMATYEDNGTQTIDLSGSFSATRTTSSS